ncbi:MAG: hypothetical protein AUJ51_08710 [Elusimicrobia bacterium CG1_02_56_21]|nr:MAG: hypothetical protein AUJ51_08710 [Elusimicrobia bacterium CG1_02_56_21]
MAKSKESRKLSAEIAKIDSQMAALVKRKQKCLGQVLIADSSESRMSMEGRREALAEALAEGIVYLGERGLLPLTKNPILGRPALAIKSESPNENPKKRSS